MSFRVVAAASLLLLAACAQEAGEPAAPGGGPAGLDPETVALRVEQTGGYLSAGLLAGRLPIITAYGDGRVITQGPQIDIYPGPALPNVLVTSVSRDDVDALVARATSAGVGATTDFGQPPMADVPSTRFTVTTEDGTRTTEVYALGEATEGNGLTEAQIAARAKLRDLLAAVTDLNATLGVTGGSEQPYKPAALAAIAAPWVATDTNLGKQPTVAWPGPALPGTPVGKGLDTGCVTVSGPDTAKVLTAATKANAATAWTSGEHRWTVILRPLLPDESDCADLLGG